MTAKEIIENYLGHPAPEDWNTNPDYKINLIDAEQIIQDRFWTNSDVDAAYFMGFIAGVGLTKSSVMDILNLELDRMKSLDIKAPHEIVKVIRYDRKVSNQSNL